MHAHSRGLVYVHAGMKDVGAYGYGCGGGCGCRCMSRCVCARGGVMAWTDTCVNVRMGSLVHLEGAEFRYVMGGGWW